MHKHTHARASMTPTSHAAPPYVQHSHHHTTAHPTPQHTTCKTHHITPHHIIPHYSTSYHSTAQHSTAQHSTCKTRFTHSTRCIQTEHSAYTWTHHTPEPGAHTRVESTHACNTIHTNTYTHITSHHITSHHITSHTTHHTSHITHATSHRALQLRHPSIVVTLFARDRIVSRRMFIRALFCHMAHSSLHCASPLTYTPSCVPPLQHAFSTGSALPSAAPRP